MSKQTSLLFTLNLLFIGVGVLLLAGCVSRSTATAPTPEDDIAEYHHITLQSWQAMDKAMAELEQVRASGTNCPGPVVEAYQQEVQDIEVGSVSIRAHAQAIVTRGDAYFETWRQHMAKMQDASTRKLADERRPLMLESFHHIKTLSAQTSAAFRPFLFRLKQVGYELESNPACVATEPTRALIATTQAEGRQVQQYLDSIQEELDKLTAIVESIKSAAKH